MPGILLHIHPWFHLLQEGFSLIIGRSLEEEAGHYFDLMVSWNDSMLAYPDHPEPGLTSLDLDPPLYELRFDLINIDPFTMDHEFVRHCLFDGLVSEKARHASVGRCSISEDG